MANEIATSVRLAMAWGRKGVLSRTLARIMPLSTLSSSWPPSDAVRDASLA